MAGIFILTIAFNSVADAQMDAEYPELYKYHKLGLIAGPILYNRAQLHPQYGDYTFKNKPMWGYNVGIEYDFFPARKWSFITGLMLGFEPVYRIEFTIKHEDTYPEYYTEDWTDAAYAYANPSFSTPLLVRLNLQADDRIFIYFTTGLKVMYFPPGEASFSIIFHNENDTEAKEVFGLRLFSPDNSFQGSFVIGSGISLALKRILLKTTFIYVMNFQNIIEGEYQFGNLEVSAPARGDYELSGNYIGLLFSASLSKRKHKSRDD